MTQLNSKLRQLFSGTNFKDAPLFLFGENFGVLAKEHLEASEALKKFQKAIPRSQGWLQVKQRPGNKGWLASGNKAKKEPKK